MWMLTKRRNPWVAEEIPHLISLLDEGVLPLGIDSDDPSANMMVGCATQQGERDLANSDSDNEGVGRCPARGLVLLQEGEEFTAHVKDDCALLKPGHWGVIRGRLEAPFRTFHNAGILEFESVSDTVKHDFVPGKPAGGGAGVTGFFHF